MLIFQASRTWDGIQTNTSAVLPKLEGSYFGQVMWLDSLVLATIYIEAQEISTYHLILLFDTLL